jgi:hypothetical protein
MTTMGLASVTPGVMFRRPVFILPIPIHRPVATTVTIAIPIVAVVPVSGTLLIHGRTGFWGALSITLALIPLIPLVGQDWKGHAHEKRHAH